MIKKFQQGGASQQSILAQIQQLPKDQQQQIMQAFSQWAQQKGVDIQQLQQNPQALEQALGQFMQEMQSQQTQAAKHGAKLQYIKSLKNQCPEVEELYYYKKGGSVGCGCKKKEDGGEVEKAQKGTVAKFKNDYSSKKVKQSQQDYEKGTADHKVNNTKPTSPKKKFQNDYSSKKVKQSEDDYFKGVADHKVKKCGGKVKKDACGSKVEKKCNGAVAKFKAACGKKLKKNQYGGSLNGIPFMQAGTPKEGLPTAPKAEDRYKNGRKEITIVHPYDPVLDYPFVGTQPIRKVTNGTASISEIIRDAKDGTPADTLYYEIPNHLPFVKVKPRYAESLGNVSSKYGINPEFHILKRRFNTAWNLAK